MMKIQLLIFFTILSILGNCNVYKSKSERRTKCMQTFLAAFPQEGPLNYTSGGYEFRFSCTTEGAYSPSCSEYFSRSALDENFLCQVGYRRSRNRCSQQNLVGTCLETQSTSTSSDGIVLVSIFSQPQNTKEEAQFYCASGDRRGNFFSAYRTPNDRSNLEKAAWDALILCISNIK